MADAQNPDEIGPRIVAVVRKIPRGPMGDHQLAAVHVHPPPDLRMRGKHRHRATDLAEGGAGSLRRSREKKLDDPFEVFERFVGIDYARQRTGLGRRARRPATFASR